MNATWNIKKKVNLTSHKMSGHEFMTRFLVFSLNKNHVHCSRRILLKAASSHERSVVLLLEVRLLCVKSAPLQSELNFYQRNRVTFLQQSLRVALITALYVQRLESTLRT